VRHGVWARSGLPFPRLVTGIDETPIVGKQSQEDAHLALAADR
jgi:hypothetical protein